MRVFSLFLLCLSLPLVGLAEEYLPQSVTFTKPQVYQKIVEYASQNQFGKMEIHDRVAQFGMTMQNIPFESFTLEIHDNVESPSVNFGGMDHWTFFETALAMARMYEQPKESYTASDLLKNIEMLRYRNGVCNGHYLDRFHFFLEWGEDNQKRGIVKNITQELSDTVVLKGRNCNKMTRLWKSYRYLKTNPSLLTGMAEVEARESAREVPYIAKEDVAEIEADLQNGDIIGIITQIEGSHCSHIGIIVRDQDHNARFLHASSKHKRVTLDHNISEYLEQVNSHVGIVVYRPQAYKNQTKENRPLFRMPFFKAKASESKSKADDH